MEVKKKLLRVEKVENRVSEYSGDNKNSFPLVLCFLCFELVEMKSV